MQKNPLPLLFVKYKPHFEMGVVQRQGIKRSILSYAGVGLGVLSTLFVYPLDMDHYGLSQFLYSSAEFLWPFMALGIPSLAVRYFPYFRDDGDKHHGFLALLLAGVLASLLLLAVFSWFFHPLVFRLIGWTGLNSTLFQENAPFVFALSALMMLSSLLEVYTSNFNRIVIPSIFNNLLPKIGLPLLILGTYYGFLSADAMRWGVVGIAALGFIGLAYYLRRLGEWHIRLHLDFLKTSPLREMATFAFYNIIAGIGTLLAFRLGTIMVASLKNTTQGGIFSIANFISTSIEIPFVALAAITGPLFSSKIKEGEWGEVAELFQRGSLTMLISGGYLFLGIVVCLDDLFQLTPNYEQLKQGEQVVWYLGLAKVISMTIALNTYVLGFSRYYRLTLISMLILSILNISLNFTLIPWLGMNGAAISTLVSVLLYNVLNSLFTWFTFKIQPLSKQSGYVFLFSLPILVSYRWLPDTGHPLINILVKGSFVTLFFIGPVWYFKVSPELNAMLQQVWRSVFRRAVP